MATYNIAGNSTEEPKEFKFLSYNVGNFSNTSSSGYVGDDLEGYITEWLRFLGEYTPDACFLTESRTYIDNANTALSKDRLYLPIYKYATNYNQSTDYGAVVLSNKTQNNIQSGLFATRVSSESKYICGTINFNGIDVFVAVAHLNHTVEGSEQASINARAAQMAELIAKANGHDNVIIGGDFNARTISEFAPFVDAGYTLANGGIFGTFETWPKNEPIYPCDSIIIKGDKLKLKDFKKFSGVTEGDHFATLATVLIN